MCGPLQTSEDLWGPIEDLLRTFWGLIGGPFEDLIFIVDVWNLISVQMFRLNRTLNKFRWRHCPTLVPPPRSYWKLLFSFPTKSAGEIPHSSSVSTVVRWFPPLRLRLWTLWFLWSTYQHWFPYQFSARSEHFEIFDRIVLWMLVLSSYTNLNYKTQHLRVCLISYVNRSLFCTEFKINFKLQRCRQLTPTCLFEQLDKQKVNVH